MDWNKILQARRVLRLRHITPWGRVRLVARLPSLVRLCLVLLRDPRVPVATKVVAGGAMALVFSPLDIVQYIPIVGEISDLVLAATILEQFVENCPRDIVQEHIEKLGLQGKFEL